MGKEHKTPTELARETGLERRDVIEKCMAWGIGIIQGRIDAEEFRRCLKAEDDTR